jgi:hypothetical protein
MLYYFIFVMMPIGAAKQRRSGIAEPRSGRSDGEGERAMERGGERWSGGSDGSIHPPAVPYIIRRATIHYIHTIRIRNIARADFIWFANRLFKQIYNLGFTVR